MTNTSLQTHAIVLGTTPIGDQQTLAHFYAETQGRITCRTTTARGHRGTTARMLLTPMTILDVTLGGKPSDEIRPLRHAELVTSPYLLTQHEPGKAAQCLYMAELLKRTVRETEANPRLWHFICHSIELLGRDDLAGWQNFHLVFTHRLMQLLGYCIDTQEWHEGCSFDLREGCFTTSPIAHPYYLNPASSSWFCRMLQTDFDNMSQLTADKSQKQLLLQYLLIFLQQQLPEVGQLRSLEVLDQLDG